jgi:hypothetical protein
MNEQIFMQVRAYLIEPDGTRKLVLERKHNALGSNIIGYYCYWRSHAGTSKPVSHIGYTYGGTEAAWGATSNASASTYSTTGAQFVATATWTNATGSVQTVTKLRLLTNNDVLLALEYGTLSGLSVVVGIGASLEVQWTLILKQNPTGGTTIPQANFSRVIEYFRAATTTLAMMTAVFTDNHGTTVTVVMGPPLSGGTTSSTNVVWQFSATAPTGADTLASIVLKDSAGNTVETKSGLSETWVAGTSITDTLTWTPVTT